MNKVEHKKTKKRFSKFLSNVGQAIYDTNIEVKINEHEFKKGKKNTLSYSFTADDIKTCVHIADSKLGFEQFKISKNDT